MKRAWSDMKYAVTSLYTFIRFEIDLWRWRKRHGRK